MSAQSESRVIPSFQQIITHLRTPIYRNGYFLMISSLSTSGIGLIYWILAAHRYSTYLVGVNSAIIAAMTFLAGVSELNLMSALMRFIPMAGKNTRRFVLVSYLVSLAVSAMISFIFIKNLTFWSPALKFLGESPAMSIWFILATMCWCIFVLQDSVLTGLRQTPFVPVENTVFSLTKIALMLIFAISLPALGIFASWTFALVVAVIPTNYFIFRKLIPAHQHNEEQARTTIEAKQVVRFAATDYMGALFWMIATTLMPVIVTTVSGATANAYFYLAWTIANTLYLIGPAMGSSLVVETAKDQQKLGIYSHRIYKNTLRIVVPVAAFILIAAPYILMIFGRGYSTQGTAVLRLLALSAIPNVINAIFVSIARAQRRVGEEVLALGVLCSLLLGTSYILLRQYGIVGVGYGWLGSQILVALFIYGLRLRNLWKNLDKVTGQTRSYRIVEDLKSKVFRWLYRVSRALNLLPILASTRQKWFVHEKHESLSAMLPEIIQVVSHQLDGTTTNHWRLESIANNQTNTIVAFLRPSNGRAPVVVKLPTSIREAESLKKQSENLVSLASDDGLGDWRRVLPNVIACGTVRGFDYYVEQAVPGTPMIELFRNRIVSWNLVNLAVSEINTLHRKTARCLEVDKALVQAWVDDPIYNLVLYSFNGPAPYYYQGAINQLQNRLHRALFERQVCVSWIHGDYSPANIMFDPSGSHVTGIVDWDLARPNELPLLDLMHLLVSLRMETRKREMGHIVSDLLVNKDWNPSELKLIQAVGQDLQGSAIDLSDLLLLTWLRHINANVTKTTRFDNHQQWAVENCISVLKALENE